MTELQLQLPANPDNARFRSRGITVSIVIHGLLFLVILMNPEFLRTPPKRIIRIAGQDYDLSKLQMQELFLPPRPRPPAVAESRPLIQPPAPEPPPQPAQPSPPVPPPAVIGPDDILAEGARPDGTARPSRGDRAGDLSRGGVPEPPKPAGREPPAPSANREGKTESAVNTNPDALRLPDLMARAGRIVDEQVQQSMRRGSGRTAGTDQGLPEQPNFSTEEPTILSDTKGYDFGPYLNQVVNRVRFNWYSLIPEAARLGRRGRVVLIFTIIKSGNVQELRMVANSGADSLDRAALGSIQASNPFPQLPQNFDGDNLVLQFTFLYNLR